MKKKKVSFLIIILFWSFLVFFTCDLFPLPQIDAAQDLGVFLDSGYRLMQGQLPHRDYSSFLGPVYAFFTGLPLVLGGAYYDSYTVYPALVGAFFSILAAVALRNLLGPILLVAFALAIGLTAGGTYQVGNPPEWTSFATHYNRLGYGFLMILAGVCILPPAQGNGDENERPVVAGILTGILFFLKINYFVAACIIVLTASIIYLRNNPFRFLALTAVGFVISAIIVFFILDWDLTSYLRDMRMIAAARAGNIAGQSHFSPASIVTSNLPILGVASFLLISLLYCRCWRGLFGSLIIISLTLVIGMTQSSHAGFGLPSFAAALVIAAAWLSEQSVFESNSLDIIRHFGTAITCIALIWFIAFPQAKSYASWARISSDITSKYGPPRRSSDDHLSTLIVGNVNDWGGTQFNSLVGEARDLAAKHLHKRETLQFVEFTNPVSFAGGFKSPKNTYLHIDKSVNFSSKEPLPADKLFANTDYIMFSKIPMIPANVEVWIDCYRENISKTFETIDESHNFKLLKKKPNEN